MIVGNGHTVLHLRVFINNYDQFHIMHFKTMVELTRFFSVFLFYKRLRKITNTSISTLGSKEVQEFIQEIYFNVRGTTFTVPLVRKGTGTTHAAVGIWIAWYHAKIWHQHGKSSRSPHIAFIDTEDRYVIFIWNLRQLNSSFIWSSSGYKEENCWIQTNKTSYRFE